MDIKGLLFFQTKKEINSLCKSFLELIENLENEGYVFAPEKRARIRKFILDNGNDKIRNLQSLIEQTIE